MDSSKELIARYVLIKHHLLGRREELTAKINKEGAKLLTNHAKLLLLHHELNELKSDIDSMKVDKFDTVFAVMEKYDLSYKFDIEALFQ